MSVKQSPGEVYKAITPDDDNDLPGGSCRGIYVGGAGDVALVGPDEKSNAGTVFTALAVGVVHPLGARRVLATGTTATSLVAVY